MTKTIALIIFLLAINTALWITFIKFTEQLMIEEGLCITPRLGSIIEVYKCNE